MTRSNEPEPGLLHDIQQAINGAPREAWNDRAREVGRRLGTDLTQQFLEAGQ